MPKLKEKLVEYVQDAHGMEEQVLHLLDSMIRHTRDAEIRSMLEHHKEETEQHERRLRERLEQLEAGPSPVKRAGAVIGASAKAILDTMRGDKPGRNARDGYVTEHLEIAAYELLERVAVRAGDEQTAEVARQNCRQEREMAAKWEASWDRVVELTLAEEEVTV